MRSGGEPPRAFGQGVAHSMASSPTPPSSGRHRALANTSRSASEKRANVISRRLVPGTSSAGDRGADRDRGREVDRESVDPGADRRCRNRGARVLRRQRKGGPVRGLQAAGLAVAPVAPARPDRMDDVARGQPAAARDHRRPGRAALVALLQLAHQLRSRGSMDRAVDTAATGERRVGGVDDRVDLQRGDVGADGARSGRRRPRGRAGQAPSERASARHTLCPPNPYEVLSAKSMRASRPRLGT